MCYMGTWTLRDRVLQFLVAEWIHVTLFGIILASHYKAKSLHFLGLMNSLLYAPEAHTRGSRTYERTTKNCSARGVSKGFFRVLSGCLGVCGKASGLRV